MAGGDTQPPGEVGKGIHAIYYSNAESGSRLEEAFAGAKRI